MSVAVGVVGPASRGARAAIVKQIRRNGWILGLWCLLIVLLLTRKLIQPGYGAPEIQSLAISALPLALAAVAQAIVVIAGGIDLSVGSMMALTNVTAAVLMKGGGEEFAVGVVIVILLMGLVLGTVNGGLVVLTRVPDIVVTLAMSFVWAGAALLVLSTPGGSAASWLKSLGSGTLSSEWVPKPLVLLIVVVGIVWVPLRRSTPGHLPIRCRQRPARGAPQRRRHQPHEARLLRADRSLLGHGRAGPEPSAPASGRPCQGRTRC